MKMKCSFSPLGPGSSAICCLVLSWSEPKVSGSVFPSRMPCSWGDGVGGGPVFPGSPALSAPARPTVQCLKPGSRDRQPGPLAMTLKFSWPRLGAEKGARNSWTGRQKQTQRKGPSKAAREKMENHKDRSETAGQEGGSWSGAGRWSGRNPRAEKDPEGPRRRPGAPPSHLYREVPAPVSGPSSKLPFTTPRSP